MAKSKRTSWKELGRDSRGRWLPREKSSKSSNKIPYNPEKSAAAKEREISSNTQAVENVLNQISQNFQKSCPRCAGEMSKHWIRCGPNKLVEVQKCAICNFWLPVSQE